MEKTEQFIRVPYEYLSVLTPIEALVFSYIESLYSISNKCYISNTKLASIFHVSVRNIQSVLSKLESLNWLKRISDRENGYERLLVPQPKSKRLSKPKEIKEVTVENKNSKKDFDWCF